MGHDETFLGSRYTSRHARWAEKLMFCETRNQSRSFAVRKAEIDGKRVPVSGSLSSPNVWSQCLPSPCTRKEYSVQAQPGQGGERERKKVGPQSLLCTTPIASKYDESAMRANTISLPMLHGHAQRAARRYSMPVGPSAPGRMQGGTARG